MYATSPAANRSLHRQPRSHWPLVGLSWIFCLLTAATTALAQDRSTALALEQQGRNADAEQAWLAIAQAEPKNPEPLAHLGLVEARQEKYADAVTHYRAALAMNPGLPGVRLNMGLALFKATRFPEAIQAFAAEIADHPGDQRLTILLGMSHYGMGDYLVAIPYLQKAATRDPQNLSLRLTLAHSCMWAKQYQCVLDVDKEILNLDPDSAEADMLAGEALDEQGDDTGAIAQFRAAAKAKPKEPNVHFGLGYLLWKQSKYADAATEFAAEVENDPSQLTARAYLGDSYVQLEQYQKGEAELLRCAQESPNSEMVHRDLGILYASTNRNDLAEKELKRAIELDGNDVAPHWRLARLYQATGRKDEAKSEFAVASKMTKQANEALAQKISGLTPASN